MYNKSVCKYLKTEESKPFDIVIRRMYGKLDEAAEKRPPPMISKTKIDTSINYTLLEKMCKM